MKRFLVATACLVATSLSSFAQMSDQQVMDFVEHCHDRKQHVVSVEVAREANYNTYFNMQNEIVAEMAAFKQALEDKNLETLLSGEYDSHNAILTFHPGAGGTEAQDWAEMLYRMYNRWAERHNFRVQLLDYLDGDEAGLKSASILIEAKTLTAI
jgi:protein subunit release factor A